MWPLQEPVNTWQLFVTAQQYATTHIWQDCYAILDTLVGLNMQILVAILGDMALV